MGISQAVILAGGMGTRLKPYTDEHPKPMYRFNDKPFLEYIIDQVVEFGIKDILMLLGYRADEIINYFGDGSKYGINIEYSVTPVGYDTGNRLFHEINRLQDKFILLYCDNYCPINFELLVDEQLKNDSDIQISVYANKDGYTKSNLRVASDGRVEIYDKKRTMENLFGVDIGYAIINKRVFDYITYHQDVILNFEKEIYPICIEKKKLYATVTEHRYYSIGSWERIKLTEDFFDNKKIIFLDRDGTINKRAPKACYIEKKEDFVWLDGAQEAIRLLKENDYRVIIVSNQPGIARGNMTEETLADIHNKMQCDLEKEIGYRIDKVYYCPHNWDEGCDCRKPKPGMLFMAQKDFSLNLHRCILVGDDDRDIEAGEAAGCICYKVTDSKSLLDIVKEKIID